MINKSKLWFLTLSSIILVLSIYYVMIPEDNVKEVFNVNSKKISEPKQIESVSITAMKIDKDDNYNKELKKLQEILLNEEKNTEEKNNAYEEIKYIKDKKVLEEKLTSLIDKEFNIASFISIEEDSIKIVVDNKDSSYNLANNIISLVNKNTKGSYYTTVKFE